MLTNKKFVHLGLALLVFAIQLPIMVIPALASGGGLLNPGFEYGTANWTTSQPVADFTNVITGSDLGWPTYTDMKVTSPAPWKGAKMLRLGTPKRVAESQNPGTNAVKQTFVANTASLRIAFRAFSWEFRGYDKIRIDIKDNTTPTTFTFTPDTGSSLTISGAIVNSYPTALEIVPNVGKRGNSLASNWIRVRIEGLTSEHSYTITYSVIAANNNAHATWAYFDNVNTAPVANDQSVSTLEDTSTNVALTATDIDGDTLTYSIVTPPALGDLSGIPPNISYKPRLNLNGPDSFTFKVNDGELDSNIAAVNITIIPVNDPPVAYAQSNTTDEDVAKAITLAASDVDGDPLTYSIVSSPAHGSVTGTLPNATYVPTLNYNGPDSFTFKANDGQADSNTATVSVTINSVNDPPVAQFEYLPSTPLEGYRIKMIDRSYDVDGPPDSIVSWSWRVYSPSAGSTVYSSLREPFIIPANDGDLEITLTVTDSFDATGSTSAPLGVGSTSSSVAPLPVSNSPPVVKALNVEVLDGQRADLFGRFVDPGWMDNHTFEWLGVGEWDGSWLEDHFALMGTGVITGKTRSGVSHDTTGNLKVTDDGGAAGSDSFKITVVPNESNRHEPNNTVDTINTANNLASGTIYLSYIQSVGDVDVFELFSDNGTPVLTNSEVLVSLKNLPADYDLVILSVKPTPPRISGGTISGGTISGGTISGGATSGGTISGGTISAAQAGGGTISGGTISGGTISGGTISGGTISGGTISNLQYTDGAVTGGTISGGTISGGTISGGTISGGTISGGTISGGTISGGTIASGTTSGGIISGGTISGGTISGATISGGTISADGTQLSGGTISGGTISAPQIVGGTISGGTISGGTISGGTISAARVGGGTISGASSAGGTISGGTISGGTISGGTISGGTISGGTISGGTISGGTISNPQYTGGTISNGTLTGGTISAGSITGGTISGGTISDGTTSGGTISGGIISGGTISGGTISGGAISSGTTSGGTISGGTISGGTISGGTISGGTISGTINTADGSITGATISGGTISDGTISAPQIGGGTISGGTISAARVGGGTISGTSTAGGTISGGTISGGTISGGSISGGTISGGTISNLQRTGTAITGGTISAGSITGGTISGGTISSGTISGGTISGGTISGGTISGGTISSGTTSGGTISGGTISGGTISGGTISGGTISGGVEAGGTLTGATISGGTISGGTISASQISGGTVSGGTISGGTISGGTISGGTISDLGQYPLSQMGFTGLGGTSVGGSDISFAELGISLADKQLGSIEGHDVKVVAFSANRGLTDEVVFASVDNVNTRLFAVVVGANSAFSTVPYSLQIETSSPPDVGQWLKDNGVKYPAPPMAASFDVTTSLHQFAGTPLTLFVTQRERMVGRYGSEDWTNVSGNLTALADDPLIAGTIISLPTKIYERWDSDYSDIDATNNVTAEIRNIVQQYLRENGTIKYVVFVGSDDIVPFGRVPDLTSLGNESQYLLGSFLKPGSPLFFSVLDGFILTDDYYVDQSPSPWEGRLLYIPDVAVARLVETPEDVIAAAQSFIDSSGTLSAGSGLVTGYDFFIDAAEAVIAHLGSAGIVDIDSLTSQLWDAAILRSMLGTGYDINNINAHYTHYAALTAAGFNSGDFTDMLSSSDMSSTTSNYLKLIFFTMGCHSGLSVPDQGVPTPEQLDFPQAMRQAIYIGNTGYGYGDDEGLGGTEHLMEIFTKKLLQYGITSGDALRAAKQRYITGLSTVSAYEAKASLQFTFYGLPQYRVIAPAPLPYEPFDSPDGELTLTVDDTNYSFTLHQVETDFGVYRTTDGDAQASPWRPILPRVVFPDIQGDSPVHGVRLIGGNFTETLNVDPVITRPTNEWEVGASEIQLLPPSFWPADLATINTLETTDGHLVQTLVVVPGQFRPTGVSSDGSVIGTERIWNLELGLLRSPRQLGEDNDWQPPTINSVDLTPAGGYVAVSVNATDEGSGITSVEVLLINIDGDTGTLSVFDASSFTDGVYTINVPLTAENTLIVQVIDGSGNVARYTGKGASVHVIPMYAGPDLSYTSGRTVNIQAFIPSLQSPVSFIWNFGDGESVSGLLTQEALSTGNFTVQHKYEGNNPDHQYIATLKITDANGGIGNDDIVMRQIWDTTGGTIADDADLITGAYVINNDTSMTISIAVNGAISTAIDRQYRVKLFSVPDGATLAHLRYDSSSRKSTGLSSLVVTLSSDGKTLQYTFNLSDIGKAKGDYIGWTAEIQDGVKAEAEVGKADSMPDTGVYGYLIW